jgi:hypothetical protein
MLCNVYLCFPAIARLSEAYHVLLEIETDPYA